MKLLFASSLLFVFALISYHITFGQRIQLVKVNNQDRVYLSTQTKKSSHSQPLIIVLHSNRSSALTTFRNESFWKRLRRPVTLLFPMATPNTWNCNEGIDHDVEFLKKIIEDADSSYLISRKKVFIIAVDDSYCVAERFKKKYGAMVKAIVRCKEFSYEENAILNKSDSLLQLPKN